MQTGIVNTAVPGESVHGTLLLYGTGHRQDTLRIGQTIQAEVIFSSEEAANVKVSNGPVLRARLAAGVRLAEGDTVWLAVKAKNGDNLVLQVVAEEETGLAAGKTPESILSRAGLHPTLLNLSLAKALREAGLSAEVDVVIQAAAILEKFPDVDVNAALFAAVNEIDGNYENLMIINSLQRSDFKVADILIRIFSLLTGQEALKAENAPPGPDGLGEQSLNAQSFFAEVNKPEDAGSLIKTVDQLKGRLEFLKTAALSSAGKEKSAAAEVDRLLHGIKLFGAINKYSYMQIPVILGGKPLTSELYVFKTKKGSRKTGADSTSFLLALDTENLGHIEALVGIRNDCITIRLRASEIEVADYLRSRTAALYEMISIQGYRLAGVLFQTEKDPVTPMAALSTARLEAGNRSLSLCV